MAKLDLANQTNGAFARFSRSTLILNHDHSMDVPDPDRASLALAGESRRCGRNKIGRDMLSIYSLAR